MEIILILIHPNMTMIKRIIMESVIMICFYQLINLEHAIKFTKIQKKILQKEFHVGEGQIV